MLHSYVIIITLYTSSRTLKLVLWIFSCDYSAGSLQREQVVGGGAPAHNNEANVK